MIKQIKPGQQVEQVTTVYNGCIKFECDDKYHIIRKTILEGENLSAKDIYFLLDRKK